MAKKTITVTVMQSEKSKQSDFIFENDYAYKFENVDEAMDFCNIVVEHSDNELIRAEIKVSYEKE